MRRHILNYLHRHHSLQRQTALQFVAKPPRHSGAYRITVYNMASSVESNTWTKEQIDAVQRAATGAAIKAGKTAQ